MPARDGTGPKGLGRSSGRGMGTCNDNTGIASAIGLRCLRAGRGLGRNRDRRFRNLNNLNIRDEITMLENRLQQLMDQMKD